MKPRSGYFNMNTTEITRSYSQKIQLEQFEPIEASAELTATLDPDDDPNVVGKELHDQCVAMVSRDISARLAAKEMEDMDEDDN